MSNENAIADKLDILHADLKRLHNDMQTIKRGIYGDAENHVDGLLQRQNKDDARFLAMDGRITKVERRQTKLYIWATALLASLQVAWNLIKESVK